MGHFENTEKAEIQQEMKNVSMTNKDKELSNLKDSQFSYTKKGKSDLWQIHGEFFDFSSFVHKHPGGVEMINIGKGRDCTELFESTHALGSSLPWQLLKIYRVKQLEDESRPKEEIAVANEQLFDWSSTGFYGELTRRLKTHFQVNNNGNHNANKLYFLKIAIFFVLYAYTLFQAFYNGSFMYAVFAAVVVEMLHFCTMHDGSHGAISKNPTVNFTFGFFTSWFFWDLWIWYRHHCYAHHSYTGIHDKDPDLTHSEVLYRKHEETPWRPYYYFQHIYIWFMMMLLPSQLGGQIFWYTLAYVRGEVFGVELEHGKNGPTNLFKKHCVYLASITAHFILPTYFLGFYKMLMINALYWTLIGSQYYLVVIPNHDTDDIIESLLTPIDNKTGEIKKVDWGDMQARNSGNHATYNPTLNFLFSTLYGGMNYQVEHHLFPTISHVHFPTISPIVEQCCKDYNIPYNCKTTWLDAVVGYSKVVKKYSNEKIE